MEAIVSYKKAGLPNNNKEVKGISFLLKEWRKSKYLYIMMAPVLLYFFIFSYMGIYGYVIAFQDYFPSARSTNFFQIFIPPNAQWVGFKNFTDFLQGAYIYRTIRNVLAMNILGIIFAFPAPIILALLLNELRAKYFKKTVQTISYIPHFISMVVVTGFILDFTSSNGLFNKLIVALGGTKINFMTEPTWFWPIYIGSGIWQELGWGSIIYLATIAAIDSSLYEAATVDGANRWKQILHITIPGLLPTAIILLIMRIGHMMSGGFEKVLLLYNPSIYETADIISTYVYRVGFANMNYGFASAVGLFNAVINLIMVISANKIGKKLTDTSLW